MWAGYRHAGRQAGQVEWNRKIIIIIIITEAMSRQRIGYVDNKSLVLNVIDTCDSK